MATSIERHDLGLTWSETTGMRRAAHALRDGDQIWLIDPFEDPTALSAAQELGRPAGVIQLLDRHDRDCAKIAQRLEVPRMRVQAALPQTPFEVIRVIARPWWREMALWWPEHDTLVVAEAVGTAPAFTLGRRVGVHPMLRLTPPRSALTRHQPERLFVGHGTPVQASATPALNEALDASVSDIPQLVLKLPSLLRGG
jgi:hypothetical protein